MKGAPPAAGHLFWAAKKGSLEEVRALLQSGLDPSQGMGTDYYFGTKETPLTAAAKEGHVEVLRALLADDRVVESLPDALLHSAREGHVEVVKALIKDSRLSLEQGNAAMMWAAQMGHLQIVKLCLEEKRLGFVSTDHTALFAASANGHVEVVEFLLHNRKELGKVGAHAMIEASRKGHLSCVMALLKNEDVTITEGSLCTSLSAAAEKGFAEVVRALLQDARLGPKIPSRPLQEACCFGHAATVRILLDDQRFDPAARSNQAACVAAQNGHDEVLTMLLADPRVNGQNAISCAIGSCVIILAKDLKCGIHVNRELFQKCHPHSVEVYDLEICCSTAWVMQQVGWSDMTEPTVERIMERRIDWTLPRTTEELK